MYILKKLSNLCEHTEETSVANSVVENVVC